MHLKQVDEKFDFEIHEAIECDTNSHWFLPLGVKLLKLKRQRPSVNCRSNPSKLVEDKLKAVEEDVKK